MLLYQKIYLYYVENNGFIEVKQMFRTKVHYKLFFISILMYISVFLLAGYATSSIAFEVPWNNVFKVLAYLITYIIAVLSIYLMYVTKATHKRKNYLPYVYLLLLIVYPIAIWSLNFLFSVSVRSGLTLVDSAFLWCALFLMFCLALVVSINEYGSADSEK